MSSSTIQAADVVILGSFTFTIFHLVPLLLQALSHLVTLLLQASSHLEHGMLLSAITGMKGLNYIVREIEGMS